MKIETGKKPPQKSHSVPVPRFYKIASALLTEVNKGESIHNLIYDVAHRNVKGLYALVCNAKRNESLLSEILSESGLINEKMDPSLAKILVTELLWGKKHLLGDCKPIQMTLSYKSKLEAAAEASSIPVALDKVTKPRYTRVNSILTTVEGTIKCLQSEDWTLRETPDSYKEFLECVLNLNKDEFMKDFHFDDVLLFHSKAHLFDNTLVKNGSLILQDKSSCLPPRLLNPSPGSTVLDMCAAPGVKTTHLANLMKNKGTLYAVDIDAKRFNIMNYQIDKFCGRHNCVTTLLKDSKVLTGDECPGVKYILLDPSCTGIGMSKRIEDRDDMTAAVTFERLEKLCKFQERILIQALTEFPNVERVVYSTCSYLEEENEQVVKRALAKVPGFHVVPPTIEKWERRGNSKYNFGANCIVSDLKRDLTNGFFVAVLERIDKNKDNESQDMETKDPEGEWKMPKKKHRKRKSNDPSMSVDEADESMIVDSDVVSEQKKKKKKKKKKKE